MIGRVAFQFAADYPADAARVLERADPAIVGTVLAGLSASDGAALLQAMSPQAAAACLEAVARETAAALTVRLPTEVAAPLLLRLEATVRAELLKALPVRAAAALRLALRFPQASVGSLIDPDVVTVRAETSIGEAVETARRAPASLRKYLYMLDEAQRLVGVVDTRQCVHQDSSRPIGGLERTELVALRARMGYAATSDLSPSGLRQAILAEAWKRFEVLPVTDHRGVFLGVVRRRSLFGALPDQTSPALHGNPGDLALDLAELFWGTASHLVLGRTAGERRN